MNHANSFDQIFSGWLEKYDEKEVQPECSRSPYYNPRTGLTDYEQARFDDMREAFEAGMIYARDVVKENAREAGPLQ